jgi:hypothetical protein
MPRLGACDIGWVQLVGVSPLRGLPPMSGQSTGLSSYGDSANYMPDVRFWHEADVTRARRDVCF